MDTIKFSDLPKAIQDSYGDGSMVHKTAVSRRLDNRGNPRYKVILKRGRVEDWWSWDSFNAAWRRKEVKGE